MQKEKKSFNITVLKEDRIQSLQQFLHNSEKSYHNFFKFVSETINSQHNLSTEFPSTSHLTTIKCAQEVASVINLCTNRVNVAVFVYLTTSIELESADLLFFSCPKMSDKVLTIKTSCG